MLELLKVELDISVTDKDQLLSRYLDKATRRVMNFTRQSKEYVEENLQNQVIDLAIITYNRKGTEGLKAQGYSGVSESYLEDMPQEIKRDLYAHRLLGGVKRDS